DVHPAFHTHAVLRIRVCFRGLPRELSIRGLRGRASRFRRAVPRDAAGGGHHAASRAARAVRPRCHRPGLLVEGAVNNLRLHRRARKTELTGWHAESCGEARLFAAFRMGEPVLRCYTPWRVNGWL